MRGKKCSSWILPASAAALYATCAVCATAGASGRAGGDRPKAVVTQTRFDFGPVFAGEQLIHVFSIRNDGTAPLTLLDKARDTEGRAGHGEAREPRIAYAAAIPSSFGPVAAVGSPWTAGEPVPT